MTDLKVTADHVRNLSVKQGLIAASIQEAKTVTDGAAPWIAVSHGLACWPSTAAVTVASYMRDAACEAMHLTSDGLQNRLMTAASRYDATDDAEKCRLDGTMHP